MRAVSPRLGLWRVCAARGGLRELDRGVEALLGAAALPGCVWLVRVDGGRDAVGYVLDLLGVGAEAGGGAAMAALGGDVGRATTAAVDGCVPGLRVVLLQVDAAAAGVAGARLRAGDLAGAAECARLLLLRDGGAACVLVGAEESRAVELLPRVATMVAAGGAARRVGPVGGLPEPGRRPPLAVVGATLERRSPRRLGAVAVALLLAAASAGAGAWVVSHRGVRPAAPVRQAQPPGAEPGVPAARDGPMLATWDRTAQVVLFGGALPGAGHGLPLSDTWRGGPGGAPPWRRVATGVDSPSPRLNGALAADTAGGYLVLFGGEGADDVGLDDTWIYAGG
jgi:hypothetical protein